MRPSPVPQDELEQAYDALIARYDSDRNAILRTLYAWFNLTLLLSFGWPALVVFFEAPLSSVANTPSDWFALRVAIPAIVLASGAWIWRSSGVPGYVASPARIAGLHTLGPLWTQLQLFVVLLSCALAGVLLVSDPTAALKVLLFGLVEAVMLQVVIAGYVKTTLEVLEAQASRAFWICVVLFGVVFALRGGLAAAIQPDSVSSVVAAAAAAGFVAGFALGVAFVYLRDRTASLLPAIILQWLIVALVPAVVS
jgi:hypothetical protein